MSGSKNESKRVETVDYDDFLENPHKALRMSSAGSVEVVDKSGRRRAYLGQVTTRGDSSSSQS
jgi:hypothetical protein